MAAAEGLEFQPGTIFQSLKQLFVFLQLRLLGQVV
jgi:hypothetical protein